MSSILMTARTKSGITRYHYPFDGKVTRHPMAWTVSEQWW
jgi:hypothetical protein